MRVIADGFVLAEAPVAGPDGELYVSDAVAGGAYRLAPDGTRTEVVPRRRGIGGMALGAGGELVVTGRSVLCGDDELLGEQPGVTGFNDLAVLPDGTLLVGALTFHPARGEAPAPGAIFCDGERLDTPHIRWPNGIGVSPDGATSYVADFADGTLHAGPLRGPWEPWARVPRGSCDGLAVDAEGGVWVALGPGAAVARLAPEGAVDELLELEADVVSSVCFAGEDLVVTTATDVRRGPVGVAGVLVPPVRPR
jgi:sugar lactone lactonase YvrE